MSDPAAELLTGILKRVSRSFYLSVAVLPAGLRLPIGLAYLFARAADTIADTKIVSRAERLEHLEALRDLFRGAGPDGAARIRAALAPHQTAPAEADLVARLDDCLTLYRGLPPEDRERIARVVLTLTDGMRLDLTTFPGEDEGKLAAVETRADLDRYTYLVAGCAGEFWTAMCIAHRPRFARWDADVMSRRGVRFGKGLQMTNVLRDLPRDLRIGRCYLARQDLRRLGLVPEDLLDPGCLPKVRPLLADLVRLTLAHYEAGWAYTLAIPRPEARIRLACAWPLLIGIQTLAGITRSPNLLDPGRPVKIPRPAVYRLMARSGLTVFSSRALTHQYETLRARLSRPG
jgi:farnesyl-diphosphate farnesyltransferase